MSVLYVPAQRNPMCQSTNGRPRVTRAFWGDSHAHPRTCMCCVAAWLSQPAVQLGIGLVAVALTYGAWAGGGGRGRGARPPFPHLADAGCMASFLCRCGCVCGLPLPRVRVLIWHGVTGRRLGGECDVVAMPLTSPPFSLYFRVQCTGSAGATRRPLVNPRPQTQHRFSGKRRRILRRPAWRAYPGRHDLGTPALRRLLPRRRRYAAVFHWHDCVCAMEGGRAGCGERGGRGCVYAPRGRGV